MHEKPAEEQLRGPVPMWTVDRSPPTGDVIAKAQDVLILAEPWMSEAVKEEHSPRAAQDHPGRHQSRRSRRSRFHLRDSQMSDATSGRVSTASEGVCHTKSLIRSRTQDDRERLWMARAACDEDGENDRISSLRATIFSGSALRRCALGQGFEMASLVVLLLHTLYVGFELEFYVHRSGQEEPLLPLLYVKCFFASFFSLEVVLRFIATGMAFVFGKDRIWNLIDTVAAAASVLEVTADAIWFYCGQGVQGTFDASGLVRIVRAARLVRIFRITRIVRFARSLRMLVYSIICTMRSLMWSLSLLLVIIYSFGIFFTQAVYDHLSELPGYPGGMDALSDNDAVLKKKWGSLGTSMLTLFEAIFGGVSWADVADPLGEMNMFCHGAFVCYVAFSSLAVLNVVTAVFCQSAIDSAQRDQDTVLQNQITSRQTYVDWVRKCFEGIDSNGTGSITLSELERHIEDERVQAFLASLEIETSDVWTLFKLLDEDGSNSVSMDEFAQGCLRLRGAARSVDLAVQSQEISWLVEKLTLFIKYVEDQMQHLKVRMPATGKATNACNMAISPLPLIKMRGDSEVDRHNKQEGDAQALD